MQEVQFTPAWRKFSFVLTALIVAAVVGVWLKSSIITSKPATAGAPQPVEAAVMSPIDLMILRGRQLPPAEYVEPF